MVSFLDVTAVFVIIIYMCYKFSTRNFDYWQKKNVPFKPPVPFLGNFMEVFTFQRQISFHLTDLYNQFKLPYFGIFVLNQPHLVVRSPELIRSIVVKDFNYFCDHPVVSDEKCDPIVSKMLFVAKNPLWKSLRTKMSPVFTTGKLKNMLHLLNQSGEEMILYLENHMHAGSIETKEICAKYSTDVITSCAFGINAHSFQKDDAEFRTVGKAMLGLSFKTGMRQVAYFFAPSIVKLFKISFFDPESINFLRNAFWNAIENRKQRNFCRNDVIDIMIQMMKENSIVDGINFEGDTVLAQAAQFFAAGFETVSTTMAFTLYELCLDSKIQDKLRYEIKNVIDSHGSITYDAVQEMKYLHMVVCETLRKYPALPFLDRECVDDYKLPGTDVIIEKGTPVFIPMRGLHLDPEYFPNPENYDPERFSDANKKNIPNFVYMPFGEGPRGCIGERFGLMATKIGIIHVLYNFILERSHDTSVPMVFDNKTLFLIPTNGIHIKFSKRRMSVAG